MLLFLDIALLFLQCQRFHVAQFPQDFPPYISLSSQLQQSRGLGKHPRPSEKVRIWTFAHKPYLIGIEKSHFTEYISNIYYTTDVDTIQTTRQKQKKAVQMNGSHYLHRIRKIISQMERKSVWISAFLPLCGRNRSSAISFWCCFSYLAILALNLPLSCSKYTSCPDSLVFKRFHVVLRHSVKRSSGAALPSEHTSPKLSHIHFLAVFPSHQRIFQIRSHWCIAQNQNSFILFKFDNPLRKVPWTLTSLSSC